MRQATHVLLHSKHPWLGGQTAGQSTPTHPTGETTSGTDVLSNFPQQVGCLWQAGAPSAAKKDTRTSHSHTQPDGKSTRELLQLFQARMLWKLLAGRSILYT